MGLFKPRSTMQRTVADQVQDRMSEIKQLFPGAKLTLVIRSEKFDQPIVVSSDEQAEVIRALRQMVPGKNMFFKGN